MKKNEYASPDMEIVEMELESCLLDMSDGTGDGSLNPGLPPGVGVSLDEY